MPVSTPLRYTVAPHAKHPRAQTHADAQADRPERILSIKRADVKEPSSDFHHAAICQLDERFRADWCCPAAEAVPVAGSMDCPTGNPLYRVLGMGPHRSERVQAALLLGPLGSLKAVMETAAVCRPCTLSQEAMEDEEAFGLRGAGHSTRP